MCKSQILVDEFPNQMLQVETEEKNTSRCLTSTAGIFWLMSSACVCIQKSQLLIKARRLNSHQLHNYFSRVFARPLSRSLCGILSFRHSDEGWSCFSHSTARARTQIKFDGARALFNGAKIHTFCSGAKISTRVLLRRLRRSKKSRKKLIFPSTEWSESAEWKLRLQIVRACAE